MHQSLIKKIWQRGYSPFAIHHMTIACVHPVTFVNYMWGQNLKGFMAQKLQPAYFDERLHNCQQGGYDIARKNIEFNHS